MQANASKFQALCVSKAVGPPVLELFIDGIIVRSEPRVKLLVSTLINALHLLITSLKCVKNGIYYQMKLRRQQIFYLLKV